MAEISKIQLPDGTSYDIQDKTSGYITSAEWGNITGTLSNQTDLQTALDTYMQKNVDYVTAGQSDISTLGTDATAEGLRNNASGNYSHAEGLRTTASNTASHAEGESTQATGYNSHAEGSGSIASGGSSHAEGSVTTAAGLYSHAEGYHTIANSESQHVFGEYNIAETYSGGGKGTYIEIVGNGSYDRTTGTTTKSNARTLDWSGNQWLAGKLTVGADPTNNMDVATKQYVDSHSSSGSTTIRRWI